MRTSADKIWLIHLHCRAFLWSFTPAHRLTTIFVVRDLLTNDFEMALLHAGKQPEHRANEGGLSVNRSLKTIDYHFWIHPSYSSCHRSGGRVHLDRSIPALRFLISFLNFLWHSLWLMLWDLHFGTSFIYLFDGSQAPLCSVKQRPLTFIFELLADLRSVSVGRASVDVYQ